MFAVLLKFRREDDSTSKVVGKMVFNAEQQRWENTAQDDEDDFMAGKISRSRCRGIYLCGCQRV